MSQSLVSACVQVSRSAEDLRFVRYLGPMLPQVFHSKYLKCSRHITHAVLARLSPRPYSIQHCAIGTMIGITCDAEQTYTFRQHSRAVHDLLMRPEWRILRPDSRTGDSSACAVVLVFQGHKHLLGQSCHLRATRFLVAKLLLT